MSHRITNDFIEEKKQDADELIREVIRKIPEKRKPELLGVINGFLLGIDSEKKTG